jgi:hypothetical protein
MWILYFLAEQAEQELDDRAERRIDAQKITATAWS